MKSVLFLALFVGFTAQAAPIKFKTLAELRARVEYYVTCSGKVNRDQVHVTFHVNLTPIGPGFGVQNAGIAIVSPNEGMMLHEWNTQMFQIDGNTPGILKFSGTSMSVHSDTVSTVIKDATNGKFKGTLYFNDNAGTEYVDLKVMCSGTNYQVPKRD